MLKIFLDVIIQCDGDSSDVLQFFTSLKTRKHCLDQKKNKNEGEVAQTYKLKLINKRV